MSGRPLFLILLAPAACTGTVAPQEDSPSGKDDTGDRGALDAGLGLRGVVLSVREDSVRISGGSRDGIREGDIFVVERIMVGYVGRIKITSVEKDYAVGIRIAGARAPGPGDTATRDDARAPVYR